MCSYQWARRPWASPSQTSYYPPQDTAWVPVGFGYPNPERLIYCPVLDKDIPQRCCPRVCRGVQICKGKGFKKPGDETQEVK